ncbi:hypothetical protein [Nitrobacter sp.]|uniref:hypothetical protein n=1 Tax=Nitrobacter sp. TaxID=29420 RepID=UPI0029CAC70C|nr:hypothetical protein [Nitrobacter sp.]
MRTTAEIDADIVSTEGRLRALHKERRDVAKARRAEICAAFISGVSIAELSTKYGLTYNSVQGLLWRAGHTIGGRDKLRAMLRPHAAERAST